MKWPNEDWRYEHWRQHMIAGSNFDHGGLPTDGKRMRWDARYMNAAIDMRLNVTLSHMMLHPHRSMLNLLSVARWPHPDVHATDAEKAEAMKP
jgi:hypothetical protein